MSHIVPPKSHEFPFIDIPRTLYNRYAVTAILGNTRMRSHQYFSTVLYSTVNGAQRFTHFIHSVTVHCESL